MSALLANFLLGSSLQLVSDRIMSAAANGPRMKPFRTSLNYDDGKQTLTAGFNALMTGVIQELKMKQDQLERQIGE